MRCLTSQRLAGIGGGWCERHMGERNIILDSPWVERDIASLGVVDDGACAMRKGGDRCGRVQSMDELCFLVAFSDHQKCSTHCP